MAVTIDTEQTESITLAEYIDHIDRNVDILDHEQVIASAPYFSALLRNRALLSSAIQAELRDWTRFQAGNNYSGQTFVLGSGKRQPFFIRANMWMPPSSTRGITDWERSMFAYELPHNHDFSFMTGGFIGSGYETIIYEYDALTDPTPGDEVPLRFLERTTLPAGKIMFFRESLDVHIQGVPREPSVSVNLMIPSKDRSKKQLFFEILADDRARVTTPTLPLPQQRLPLVAEMSKILAGVG